MKMPSSHSILDPIKRHRNFVGLIVILIVVCVFCAVLNGIKYSKSSLLISFSNVTIVKYLRGDTGFGNMLFTNIFTIGIFSAIILLSCCKIYSMSIGVFFYCYYVYAQTLTLIAFVLEFGLINTMVIAFCMLLSMCCILFLLLEVFVVCMDNQGSRYYYKSALISCTPILIGIIVLLLAQNLIFFVLRNYIIVLVY